jgi:hypothetical protein
MRYRAAELPKLIAAQPSSAAMSLVTAVLSGRIK